MEMRRRHDSVTYGGIVYAWYPDGRVVDVDDSRNRAVMHQRRYAYKRAAAFVHSSGKEAHPAQLEEVVDMVGPVSEGQIDFESFGDILTYLRRTYGARTGRVGRGLPKVHLTALSLIDCLTEHGYPITSGAYSLLEQGKTLPKNPDRFFEAVCKCLAIDSSDKYWTLLRYQYMYDMMARSVSREFADKYAPRGQRALDISRPRHMV